MKTPIIAVCMLLSTLPLRAHLGENPVQCQIRYGDPIEEQTDDYGNKVLLFKKSGFDIFITFLNDKAAKVQYGHSITKLGIGEPISDNEKEILLKSNYAGTWKKNGLMGMAWESEDGNFLAKEKTFSNLLFIYTKEYLAFQNAQQKAKETENLKGL